MEPFTFEIYRSYFRWRWRLKAGNHEIIAQGQGYLAKASVYKVIERMRWLVADAGIKEV
jgi:uncharacterized protein YegP (UPF0339 family)